MSYQLNMDAIIFTFGLLRYEAEEKVGKNIKTFKKNSRQEKSANSKNWIKSTNAKVY
jgi:hypothetical protein